MLTTTQLEKLTPSLYASAHIWGGWCIGVVRNKSYLGVDPCCVITLDYKDINTMYKNNYNQLQIYILSLNGIAGI